MRNGRKAFIEERLTTQVKEKRRNKVHFTQILVKLPEVFSWLSLSMALKPFTDPWLLFQFLNPTHRTAFEV
jgi:hypothetical protein